MLYFAYGTDLSVHAVLDYCHTQRRPAPRRLHVRPAVLTNHRIQFSRHDAFLGGGVADVVPETGKSVSGALMEVSDLGLETLRQLSHAAGREIVKVTPITGGPPLEAATFLGGTTRQPHVPPSKMYLDRLINAAVELGLSMMWVMQLQTFARIGSENGNSPLRLELSDGPRGHPPQKPSAVPSPVRPSIPFRPVHDPNQELVNC